MWYVYIIRSIEFPDQEYIGATEDLKRRFPSTTPASPAHVEIQTVGADLVLRFPDKKKALAFEKYLKSDSGRAFAKKRL